MTYCPDESYGGLDANNGGYLSHVLFEIAFDAKRQRHAARRTPDTRAMESNADHAIRVHIDKLHVSAVVPDGRPDEIQDGSDPTAHRGLAK